MTAEDRVKIRVLDFHIQILVKSANLHPRDLFRVRVHQELIEATLEVLNELRGKYALAIK